MITINVHQAKTHLSHYLNLVEQGEKIVLSRRNIPIAELKPINKFAKIKPQRKLGQCKDKIIIHDSFFDPLPDEILEAFNNPK